MKKFAAIFLIAFSTGLHAQGGNPNNAYVNINGCVVCDQYTSGSSFTLNGTTYTAVNRSLLETMRDNGTDLSQVCVSLVTDMTDLFLDENLFNGNINYWDVSNVTSMVRMFDGATSFNQDLTNWDVSNVTSMEGMFWNAQSFDGAIENWDVSSVQNMRWMFDGALNMQADIGNWDVSNISNSGAMGFMFNGASSFNHDLSGWCVTNIPSLPTNFSTNSALSAANHPVWGTCPPPNYNPNNAYVDSVAPGLGCVVCDQYAAGDTFSTGRRNYMVYGC